MKQTKQPTWDEPTSNKKEGEQTNQPSNNHKTQAQAITTSDPMFLVFHIKINQRGTNQRQTNTKSKKEKQTKHPSSKHKYSQRAVQCFLSFLPRDLKRTLTPDKLFITF